MQTRNHNTSSQNISLAIHAATISYFLLFKNVILKKKKLLYTLQNYERMN